MAETKEVLESVTSQRYNVLGRIWAMYLDCPNSENSDKIETTKEMIKALFPQDDLDGEDLEMFIDEYANLIHTVSINSLGAEMAGFVGFFSKCIYEKYGKTSNISTRVLCKSQELIRVYDLQVILRGDPAHYAKEEEDPLISQR